MPRLIDISLPVYPEGHMHSPHIYPTSRITPVLTPDMPGSAGRTTRKFDGLLHTGTHVNAPEHFVKGGRQIQDIPLETFMGEALVVDLTHRAPGGTITGADLEQACAGKLKPHDRLLVRTNWNKNYGSDFYFRDTPLLSPEASQWLVDREVLLFGRDFLGSTPDEKEYEAERIMLAGGVIDIIALDNLDQITVERVTLIAFPIKLIGAEAAWCRAVVSHPD